MTAAAVWKQAAKDWYGAWKEWKKAALVQRARADAAEARVAELEIMSKADDKVIQFYIIEFRKYIRRIAELEAYIAAHDKQVKP